MRSAFEPALGRLHAALARQQQHRALDARVVPAVVRAVEFRDLQAVPVFNDGFRAGAAHGRAGE